MRKLALGNPANSNDIRWAIGALKEIERASFEDIEALVDDYTISGAYTETRTLTPSTAAAADIANFLATFITDLQKRGQHRTGAEA
jgi:hypothetical protein